MRKIPIVRVIAGVLAGLVLALAFAAAAEAQTVNYDLKSTSVLRINLPASQAVTVTMSDPVGKIVVADPKIADAQPITDKSLYVVGKAFGTTTVNLYSDTGTPVGLLAVQIGVDTADVAHSIRSAVPDARVHVATINGRVRLSGSVPDAGAMQRVLDVLGQYGMDSASIVNTVTFAGGQQVNLEVRILEAQRDAGRELGLNWGGSVGGVRTAIGGGPNNPAADAPSFASFVTGLIGAGINLDVTINALETKRLVRTLADPNLTTLSGGTASFLAGGQVPILVPDANGNATVTYKDFGVKLAFTPVVLDGNRIQIHLAPEVSDIAGSNNAGLIFNTRNLDATVELRDGQSFSIAGLLQNSTTLDQNQLPWLGDVPILGSLFKSSSYQKHETEMVVIVTPRLVQPNTPTQVASSPLDKTKPADDAEFFAIGQMEVTPKMIKSFQTGAGAGGPTGYIIDLGPEGGK